MSAGDIPICLKCGLAIYPGYHHNHIHDSITSSMIIYSPLDLFVDGLFISNSGNELEFKIEADVLSDKTIETLAKIIHRKKLFSEVYGIPTGGERLAKALEKYAHPEGGLLIVDDVFTTGNSMEKAKQKFGRLNTAGAVIFARGPCPDWIEPILSLNSYYNRSSVNSFF